MLGLIFKPLLLCKENLVTVSFHDKRQLLNFVKQWQENFYKPIMKPNINLQGKGKVKLGSLHGGDNKINMTQESVIPE